MQTRIVAIMMIVMIALSGASVTATGVQTSPVQNVESQNVTEVSVNATPTVSNRRPTSRGHISITDKDSRTYAKIKMNYLSTDHDRIVAAKGLKLTRKIVMESETFKKYKPEEYRPGLDINDDEELVKAGSDYTQTIFHPVGTCKMGQDDMAVVDEKLRVKGIKNLRVIDASIMPNITSGNTNAPTIMIAEKAADMIIEDSRS